MMKPDSPKEISESIFKKSIKDKEGRNRGSKVYEEEIKRQGLSEYNDPET